MKFLIYIIFHFEIVDFLKFWTGWTFGPVGPLDLLDFELLDFGMHLLLLMV
jgi:hypothetical protein